MSVGRSRSAALCGLLALAAFAAGAVNAAGGERRAHTFSHLPDWTGQWQIIGVNPDPSGGIEQSFAETLAAMKRWGPPPYKPEAQRIFNAVVANARKHALQASRDGSALQSMPRCSWGVPMLMLDSPLMFEVLITPEETAMIFSGREIRHIYTDGRTHTPKDQLWATQWGDSIGRWEGKVLVIDTIAVVNSTPFGSYPAIFAWGGGGDSPIGFAPVAILSPEARFIERVRMLDSGHLEDRMTVIDPRVLRAPWHLRRLYERVTRIHRMVHEDCEGEDRNPMIGGRFTLAPPAPPPPQLPPPFSRSPQPLQPTR